MVLLKYKRLALAVLVIVLAGSVIGVCLYFFVFRVNSLKGAVVTNGYGCSKIGTDILEQGGSAVDAAIAALFCEGVSMPAAMGLGGGFLMTIYDKSNNKVESLNSREVAPENAHKDMYNGSAQLSSRGILSVAVPGELRGYWYAYQRYGKLPWKNLVQPTIDICKNGILVTPYLEGLFNITSQHFYNDPKGLGEIFINKETNSTYREGEYMKRLNLAKTLEIIAEDGGDALHNGSLTDIFLNELQSFDGNIITKNDLMNYRPQWQESIEVDLPDDLIIYTTPLPGSGAILAFIMNLLSGYLDLNHTDSITNWQRMVESFKFGYGKRTELGDIDFVPGIKELLKNYTSRDYAHEIRKLMSDTSTHQDPEYYGAKTDLTEDHGTAQVSVLAPNGDAVSVTSTVNLYFGSGIMLPETGIILNDEMDDFSNPNINNSFGIPPSPANYIEPGKRPLSSMCPSIVVDKDRNVRLVTGAAGGTKITTSVATIIVRHLWYKIQIQEATDDMRMHHQLFPMEIQFESSFKKRMDIVEGLEKLGHKYSISEEDGFAAAVSIASSPDGDTVGATDKRRSGSISYI